MFAVVSPEKVYLSPGTVVRSLSTWQEYQALCQQRGDGSIPRIKYRSGEVLLMSPLPKYGRDASLIADIIKVLLDRAGRWQAVSGKERIDWSNDPPPDLVLEIDVTSYSDVNDYLSYRVPEVWLFRKNQLVIYQLQGDEYVAQAQSRYFPEINLQDAITRCLQLAYERNNSAAIQNLKQQLSNQL